MSSCHIGGEARSAARPSPKSGKAAFWKILFLRLAVVAVFSKRAAVAVGFAGGAAVAAEQHQSVAEVVRLLRRQDGAQLLFDAQRVLAAVRQAEAARDADAVRVAHVGGLAVDVAEDQVRRFAPDAGEGCELLHRAGDLAAVLFEQDLRALDDVLRLRVVKSAGADRVADLFIRRVREGLKRRELLIERRRDHVHARVGALGGKAHGEQKLVVLFIFERAARVGVEDLQLLHDAADGGFGFHGETSCVSSILPTV